MAGRPDHHRFRRWRPILCGMVLFLGWPSRAGAGPRLPPAGTPRSSRGLGCEHHARGRAGGAAPPDGGLAQEDARPGACPPARVDGPEALDAGRSALDAAASVRGTPAGEPQRDQGRPRHERRRRRDAGRAGCGPRCRRTGRRRVRGDRLRPHGHGLRAGGRAAVATLRYALRGAQHPGSGTVRPRVPDPLARRRVRHPIPQPDRARRAILRHPQPDARRRHLRHRPPVVRLQRPPDAAV